MEKLFKVDDYDDKESQVYENTWVKDPQKPGIREWIIKCLESIDGPWYSSHTKDNIKSQVLKEIDDCKGDLVVADLQVWPFSSRYHIKMYQKGEILQEIEKKMKDHVKEGEEIRIQIQWKYLKDALCRELSVTDQTMKVDFLSRIGIKDTSADIKTLLDEGDRKYLLLPAIREVLDPRSVQHLEKCVGEELKKHLTK